MEEKRFFGFSVGRKQKVNNMKNEEIDTGGKTLPEKNDKTGVKNICKDDLIKNEKKEAKKVKQITSSKEHKKDSALYVESQKKSEKSSHCPTRHPTSPTVLHSLSNETSELRPTTRSQNERKTSKGRCDPIKHLPEQNVHKSYTVLPRITQDNFEQEENELENAQRLLDENTTKQITPESKTSISLYEDNFKRTLNSNKHNKYNNPKYSGPSDNQIENLSTIDTLKKEYKTHQDKLEEIHEKIIKELEKADKKESETQEQINQNNLVSLAKTAQYLDSVLKNKESYLKPEIKQKMKIEIRNWIVQKTRNKCELENNYIFLPGYQNITMDNSSIGSRLRALNLAQINNTKEVLSKIPIPGLFFNQESTKSWKCHKLINELENLEQKIKALARNKHDILQKQCRPKLTSSRIKSEIEKVFNANTAETSMNEDYKDLFKNQNSLQVFRVKEHKNNNIFGSNKMNGPDHVVSITSILTSKEEMEKYFKKERKKYLKEKAIRENLKEGLGLYKKRQKSELEREKQQQRDFLLNAHYEYLSNVEVETRTEEEYYRWEETKEAIRQEMLTGWYQSDSSIFTQGSRLSEDNIEDQEIEIKNSKEFYKRLEPFKRVGAHKMPPPPTSNHSNIIYEERKMTPGWRQC